MTTLDYDALRARLPEIRERVRQFSALQLPGQPMGMHMGTMYLVNDLDGLVALIPSMLEEIGRLQRALYEAEQAAERMALQIQNDEAVAAGYGPDEVRRP